MTEARTLSSLYSKAADVLRGFDGLQPQEAFDELLKYLFLKQTDEERLLVMSAHESAQALRQQFSNAVRARGSFIKALWKKAEFALSDEALTSLHRVFAGVRLSSFSIDLRAAAMRQFLSPEVRSGLGIYLTPDEVVREVIAHLDLKPGERFLDPACGSGTFLIEAARHLTSAYGANQVELFAVDKNPRMLLLTELNTEHFAPLNVSSHLFDSLVSFDKIKSDFYQPRSMDVIATNPPFGVAVDITPTIASSYLTARSENHQPLKRQASEVLFIERCLELLKPGGRLAIVLPRSVLSNARLQHARDELGKLGFIYSACLLPPETFAAFGTQTNALVVFIQKYKVETEFSEPVLATFVNVSNVGYDSTGRHRRDSDLPGLAARLKSLEGGGNKVKFVRIASKRESFSKFALEAGRTEQAQRGVPLSTIASVIATGRTPARNSYTDEGLFILKVGNLTGTGVNWSARDRNFVGRAEAKRRNANTALMVRPGDIVLTSSAHSPAYIAKKVDLVSSIPSWLGGQATFVGELMLVRLHDGVDPYSILQFMRKPSTMSLIHSMIRGQTAHLHPSDLGSLVIPEQFVSNLATQTVDLLRQEAALNERMNQIQWTLTCQLSSEA